jgi:hypothetical protein
MSRRDRHDVAAQPLFDTFDHHEMTAVLATLCSAGAARGDLDADLLFLVYHARHGSALSLQQCMAACPQQCQPEPRHPQRYHGVPLIMQPLIECDGDFAERVELLATTLGVATIALRYEAWAANALHMLLYKKDRARTENELLRAAGLLIAQCPALLHQTDSDRRTPLVVAATRGLWRVCRAMLRAGAHADTKDRFAMTAIELALRAGLADLCYSLPRVGISSTSNTATLARAVASDTRAATSAR